MNTVPRDLILESWNRQCDLDESASRELVQRFSNEQPALVVYLAAMSETLGDDAENSQLIPLALTIWESMTEANNGPLQTVDPDTIEKAESANMKMLEQLSDASEMEWTEAAGGILTGYNQQEILGTCLEILMSEDEENPELAPEHIGLELIWLKTLIDCLDQ